MALHDHVEHALVLVGELVLVAACRGAGPSCEHHFADAGVELAAQHLHEGGFAAAVGADEPVAVAIGELDRDVFEEGLGAELNGYVGGRKHGSSHVEGRWPRNWPGGMPGRKKARILADRRGVGSVDFLGRACSLTGLTGGGSGSRGGARASADAARCLRAGQPGQSRPSLKRHAGQRNPSSMTIGARRG